MTTAKNGIVTKGVGTLEIKDAEKGEVTAVVATLGVVDKDREVILPGAIKDGARVKLSLYGHGAVFGDAPVGKGTLSMNGDRVLFNGQFFMTTSRGNEAFRTIKELGPDQEWSIGYRVVKWSEPNDEWRAKGAMRILEKLDVFEVSPVIIGAGEDTGTVAVKCDGCGTEQQEGQPCAPCAEKAEAQAAADAETARQAEATRAAEEARRTVEVKKAGELEYEKFQRTMRRFSA